MIHVGLGNGFIPSLSCREKAKNVKQTHQYAPKEAVRQLHCFVWN